MRESMVVAGVVVSSWTGHVIERVGEGGGPLAKSSASEHVLT